MAMQAVVPGIRNVSFGSAPSRAGQPSPQERADAFSQGLKALLTSDRNTPTPVFTQVKTEKLQQRVNGFLARQAQAPSHPTPFLINLSGGSSSGKSTVMNLLSTSLQAQAQAHHQWNPERHGPVVETVEVDHYYRDYAQRRKELGDVRFFRETNLDEPAALTLEQAAQDVMRLKNGLATRGPLFDFTDSSRQEAASLRVPAPFLLYEGLFTLNNQPLQEFGDLRLFVEADESVRSERFWKRAPARNIRPDEGGWALHNRVMEMHNQHVQPSKPHADLVLNGNLPLEKIENAVQSLASLLSRTLYPVGNASSQKNQSTDTPEAAAPKTSWMKRLQAWWGS
jgi:uridine kinase